jgi:hypothetical protein
MSIHDATVTQNALLPIGQISEEAAEARNKYFRLYQQNFSRKFSRVPCNLDVLIRLLLSLDPVINGMRPVPRKKTQRFLKETVDMLLTAAALTNPDTEDSHDDSPQRNYRCPLMTKHGNSHRSVKHFISYFNYSCNCAMHFMLKNTFGMYKSYVFY